TGPGGPNKRQVPMLRDHPLMSRHGFSVLTPDDLSDRYNRDYLHNHHNNKSGHSYRRLAHCCLSIGSRSYRISGTFWQPCFPPKFIPVAKPTLFTDSSPPCTGFLTPIFDELFEAFEIALDSTGNYSERISSLFNKTFGVIHQLETNASTIRIHGRKVDNTRCVFTAFVFPGNPMIGDLIRDSSVPLLSLPAISASQCRRLLSNCVTFLMPFMNLGNS